MRKVRCMPVRVGWSAEYRFGRVEKESMRKKAKSTEMIDREGKKADVIGIDGGNEVGC
jgi:hypothetical protein